MQRRDAASTATPPQFRTIRLTGSFYSPGVGKVTKWKEVVHERGLDALIGLIPDGVNLYVDLAAHAALGERFVVIDVDNSNVITGLCERDCFAFAV